MIDVLFTGYAHVHFACFRPLFERLRHLPSVRLWLSGGLRTPTESGDHRYDLPAMYAPFDVPESSLLPVEALADRDFDVLFAGNTKLILPRSVRTRVQIFHGISFRNRAVRPENMGCDHYFVVGPYMHRRFIANGLLSRNDPRAVPIGFMKTDRLLDTDVDRSARLERLGFSGDRPVVLYAPTGARKNSLETMGKRVIKRLVASDRFDLVVKPHDHPKNKKDWFTRLAPFEGPHCRITREPDVIPLLAAADLLLTDASSVSSEYALLDRPMVFLDVPELVERAAAREGSQLDLDTWGRAGGDVVESPDAVVDAVTRALESPERHRDVRRSMARDLFYNPGRATAAAEGWFRAKFLDESGRADGANHEPPLMSWV